MPDKLIKDLTALTDGQVNDDTKLIPIGNTTTGEAFKGTIAQLKLAMGRTFKTKYVATGAEGTTLTIPAIAGMYIISITREGQDLYEVSATPDTVEYIWDSTNITLGLATNAGERFGIQYRAI